ncbi:FecCD family ABC transporter permease [candidate division CSSED10-310 bacterium]|uniref:FecCD family ABC transporter permease n=1 Tax=candidate division CSSED10-310 bacterium TaxID=2855610 RepID=A0ABV6YX80_UNCC1
MTVYSETGLHYIRTLGLYCVPILLSLMICPLVGSENLDFQSIIQDLLTGDFSIDSQIIFEQRFPRVLLGLLVGGALAMTGAVFQVILRNPLAEPYTLGVTGGGAVGAALAFFYPALVITIGPFSTVQIFSLLGSSIILAIIYMIAIRQADLSMSSLLLAGVTLGITCGSFILLLRYLANPHQLVVMDRWLMGGLDVIGYRDLASLFPLLLPGFGFLIITIPSLNLLTLGKDMAAGQGVDVTRIQKYAFIGGSLATASVVSLAGPIGFVGLIIPHMVRKISGYDHRIVVPASFCLGSAFLVVCDTIARTIIAPMEMPVGVITALLGGPFFLYLLVSHRTRKW